MKRITSHIAVICCCLVAVSCKIDNYTEPDATIQGTIYDHNGQPLQVEHGSQYIRIRETSWTKGEEGYIGNRRLSVQQDGTYRNTKQFAGDYLMLPSNGNFFPYWDADDPEKDGDNAGEQVKISGTVNKDFVVTPYLTIEWVKPPTVTPDNYLECTVRFTRNQKAGYNKPYVKEASLAVARMVNTSGSDGLLFPTPRTITNAMEGQDIVFRTAIPLRYTGVTYWVRVGMNCQTAPGDASTNYPGMGARNFSTIEKIYVP